MPMAAPAGLALAEGMGTAGGGPLCPPLWTGGVCGAWQGQRSSLGSRGVPGLCCHPGAAPAPAVPWQQWGAAGAQGRHPQALSRPWGMQRASLLPSEATGCERGKVASTEIKETSFWVKCSGRERFGDERLCALLIQLHIAQREGCLVPECFSLWGHWDCN